LSHQRPRTFTMEFDHYEEVPASMVAKLMEKEAK
jgi:elongation factor G